MFIFVLDLIFLFFLCSYYVVCSKYTGLYYVLDGFRKGIESLAEDSILFQNLA